MSGTTKDRGYYDRLSKAKRTSKAEGTAKYRAADAEYRRYKLYTDRDEDQVQYMKDLEMFLVERKVNTKYIWGQRGIFTGVMNKYDCKRRIDTAYRVLQQNGLYEEWMARGDGNEQ